MSAAGARPSKSAAGVPLLPSVTPGYRYALPWDTKLPMYPHTPRVGTAVLSTSGLRPMQMKSSFGEQVHSMRESPAGVVLHGGPNRFNLPSAKLPKPLMGMRMQGPFGHLPSEYGLSAFGLQPLSSMNTASRLPDQSEDRWAPMARRHRQSATPGPGSYNPI